MSNEIITISDYLKYVIENKIIFERKWLISVMSIPIPNLNGKINNEFFTVVDDKYYVKMKIEDEEVLKEVAGITSQRPLLHHHDDVIITKKLFPNIESDTLKTTVGRALLNYVSLVYPFKDKIAYFNKKFDPGDVEQEIAIGLSDDTITVQEYRTFTKSILYTLNLTRIVNLAGTYKSIVGPPDRKEFKAALVNEYNSKYGPDWRANRTYVTQFEDALIAHDKEFLKDDPTLGTVISNKTLQNSRAKLYGAFGSEASWWDKGQKVNFVENSLMDGYPMDPVQLAIMYNTARSGSYKRGLETQKGGAAAKDTLRATSAIQIIRGDCGTKIVPTITLTKDNIENYYGAYYIKNNKPVLISPRDADVLIGSSLPIRVPSFCIEPNGNYCSTCVGENLARYKAGASLGSLETGGVMLTISLKVMHTSKAQTIDVNLLDIMS